MGNQKLLMLQTTKGIAIENHPVPVSNWLNGKILEVTEGMVVMEYPARKEMDNGLGIVQGGILATMADNTIAYATFSLGREYHFNTVGFHIEYHAPAPIGQPVIAEARITREGKTIVFVECMLYNTEKKLLTKTTSTLVVRTK